MNAAILRLIQADLDRKGFAPGPVDGRLGPNTAAAVERALNDRTDVLQEGWRGWPDRRKTVAWLQLMAQDAGIDSGPVDGFFGPQTSFAADSLLHLAQHGTPPPLWRDEEPPAPDNAPWPVDREADMIRAYGATGGNQTRLALPYRHRLSWDLRQSVTSFMCHEKVHDSLKRVLTRVVDHYGPERIAELRLDRWGGCLNVRRKRGGSAWSTHAWGVALDYDPDRNQLQWGRDRAAFARPEYDMWWRLWEEEGWISLGRWRNFDWMHIQAARLP